MPFLRNSKGSRCRCGNCHWNEEAEDRQEESHKHELRRLFCGPYGFPSDQPGSETVAW
jgi:hypothetical protein